MKRLYADPQAIEINAIRASGPGGQNVNKVATAVELRFDVAAANLPKAVKERVLSHRDRRINTEGVIVIKAQRFRSQEKNRQDAIDRLEDLLNKFARPPKKRIATKPGRAAKERRLREKKKVGDKKSGRGSVNPDQG